MSARRYVKPRVFVRPLNRADNALTKGVATISAGRQLSLLSW